MKEKIIEKDIQYSKGIFTMDKQAYLPMWASFF